MTAKEVYEKFLKKDREKIGKMSFTITGGDGQKQKLKIVTNWGDTVEIIGSTIWSNFIELFKEDYEIREDNSIKLKPEVFWKWYKGDYKHYLSKNFILNGKKSNFAPVASYFEKDKQCIYGIFYEDKLFYIGSSSNYSDRWLQHVKGFMEKGPAKLYKKDYDINKISFEILLEEKDIKEIFDAEVVNMWEYERVEKELIENLKPDGNIEGVRTTFSYNSSMRKYLTKKQEVELKSKVKKYLKKWTWEVIIREE